ncbi:PREDICTED: chromodomain-helicase-DNA-binding protein 8-like, partial [Priapulus caudatus]|uniref:Chromodomain-helicase-DNA-binding protein 8-like n=1 Tax=Priapulus caudatus TaxID=37621 RepID=A0ABM1F732_PRICU
DDRIIYEPRKRNQTKRFGNDDSKLDISDLDSSSDEEAGSRRGGQRRSRRSKGRRRDSDDEWDDSVDDGATYTRSDCFKVEKNLLHYGWGRWDDILSHCQFKRERSIKEIEDMTRTILAVLCATLQW